MSQAPVTLHPTTFDYFKPNPIQRDAMQRARDAARVYADVLTEAVPDGPDKTYLLRKLREVAMWANVSITRHADGAPRT